MIRVIGQKNLLSSTLWRESTVEECLEYFKDHKSIAIDTETQGRDPHTKKILSLQIGDELNQWVIDCRSTNILLFKSLLERKLCLIHNMAFDYKFLKKAGIVLTQCWDTCISEAIIYRGIKDWGYALDKVCDRYCGVKLNKDVRSEFHLIKDEPFTDIQIQYAALDVTYLHQIAKEQWREAVRRDVLNSVLEDNRALFAYADMEYYGNKVDVDKWAKNALKNEMKLGDLIKELDEMVLDEPKLAYLIQEYYQGDLFSDDKPRKVDINWYSDSQVKKAFNVLGVANGKLESVGADVIKYHTKDHPIVSKYIQVSKQAKLVSTYGRSFIETCLNKATGRIHTSYWIALNTGRCSSGGGRDNPVYPNLQNIPNDKQYREMFVAEPGNVLITSDYSQLEPRVLADLCKDPTMIDLFINGDGDTHTMTANALYSVIEGKPVSIDKNDPRRQVGKVLNLKLNYGGSAYTVKDDLGKTIEETQLFINALQKAFPKKTEWQKSAMEAAFKEGFIILEKTNGSKCFLDRYNEFLELEKVIKAEGFWDHYKIQKAVLGEHFNESEIRQTVSKYFKWKGSIERNAINYPCQGTAAGIVKRAMILVRQAFIDLGIYDQAKLINQVHDELIVECPKAIADQVACVIRDSMITAGRQFCKQVPMVVEPNIKTYWAK